MSMINNNEFVEVSDLPMAATLAMYFPLEKVDRTNPDRVMFLFRSDPAIRDLIDKYQMRHVQIEPHMFYMQIKILKTQIFNKFLQ